MHPLLCYPAALRLAPVDLYPVPRTHSCASSPALSARTAYPRHRHGWARVVRADKGMTTVGVVLSVCGCLVGLGWIDGWYGAPDGWICIACIQYAPMPILSIPDLSRMSSLLWADRCNAGLFWQSRNGWNGRMDGMDEMDKNGLESESRQTLTCQPVSKPASYFLPPASCVPASCFLLPASCFLLSASCFLLPVSCFLFPVSCFLFSVFCFLLPASCFPLPASCFLLPAPCFLLTNLSATNAIHATQMLQRVIYMCEWACSRLSLGPFAPSPTSLPLGCIIHRLGRLGSKRPLPTFLQSFHAGAKTVREKPFAVTYSLHHVGSWMRVGCVVYVLEENARNTLRLGFHSPPGWLASSVQVSPPQPRDLLQDRPSHPISCVPIAYHADHATPHFIRQARIYSTSRTGEETTLPINDLIVLLG